MEKKIKHQEANFLTNTFLPWVRKNMKESFAFEAKTTRGKDSFLFSAMEPHQVINLHNASHGIFAHKISDSGIRGKLPFDGFVFYHSPAYVVIEYPRFWCMVDIDVFENEERTSVRRSIKDCRAMQIASVVIDK